MRTLRVALGCSLCLVLACSTKLAEPSVDEAALERERNAQLAIALKMQLARGERLAEVASRIRVAGAELCGEDVSPVFGLFWVHPDLIDDKYEPVIEAVGLGSGLRVVRVLESLPADGAGLRDGDTVLAIDGKKPRTIRDVEKALEAARETGILRLNVRAADEPEDRVLAIQGLPACKYPVTTAEEDAINAYADGSQVVVLKGMMRFAEKDEELALVIAHEIAHNSLGHAQEGRALVAAGTAVGLLADVAAAVAGVDTGGSFTELGAQVGQRVYSADRERDADYMALYIMQRAGYDISGAPDFWRRMAAEHPEGIEETFLASHPSTPERSVALEAAIVEIEEKQIRGEPLTPDRE